MAATAVHAERTNDCIEAVQSTIDLSRVYFDRVSTPNVVDTDLSSEEGDENSVFSLYEPLETPELKEKTSSLYRPTSVPLRPPLGWKFHGLTIWVELEEFDFDLSKVISDLSSKFGVQAIPRSHATAIYGMTHLSENDAKRILRQYVRDFGGWPSFRRPVGVVQDVAVAGNPGQVCSIAWAQLTLTSGPEHEKALDGLYDTFFGAGSRESAGRHRPWTPHNSIVYDNPENTVLSLVGALECIAKYPTLLGSERRVEALSLWRTEGRMDEWECIDRVKLF